MEKDKIRELRFGLNGNADIRDPAVLTSLINAITAESIFTPEVMGLLERELYAYSSTEIFDELQEKLNFGLYLQRKKQVKYFGKLRGGPTPMLSFDFSRSMSKKNIEKLFNWGDIVADAFTPDAGSLTIVPVRPAPKKTEDMRLEQVFRGSWFNGNYFQTGPFLGMHTWLGPHFVQLIGLDNLKATPLTIVEEKPWGGVKMTLGKNERPWEMDLRTYIDTWFTAMEYLWQFGVFCEQEIDGLKLTRVRGRNCTIPRLDGLVR